ncbi:hypothetical protein DFJ74DRAFT_176976 [Hyaloraphidium curvatum]|nr:hypothetical protein DFJ74DRAFT_176976 [Hyaloraphidium curvatum]
MPKKQAVAATQPRPPILPPADAHALSLERSAAALRPGNIGACRGTGSLPPLWKAAGDLNSIQSSSLMDLVAKAPPVDPADLRAKTRKAKPAKTATAGESRAAEKREPADAVEGSLSSLEYFELSSGDEEGDEPKASDVEIALAILRERYSEAILTYTPLAFEQTLALLNFRGLRISKASLAQLLDSHGIVYLEASKPRQQRTAKRSATA